MALHPGNKLGPYEILAPLGAGTSEGGERFGAPKVLFTKPEGADGDFVALKNGREFVLQTAVPRAAAEPKHGLLDWAAG